jgi:hypothetical protein
VEVGVWAAEAGADDDDDVGEREGEEDDALDFSRLEGGPW